MAMLVKREFNDPLSSTIESRYWLWWRIRLCTPDNDATATKIEAQDEKLDSVTSTGPSTQEIKKGAILEMTIKCGKRTAEGCAR